MGWTIGRGDAGTEFGIAVDDHYVLTMSTRRERIEIAVAATAESNDLDFKERFDPKSARDWCGIVKDIVAMANTGGGCLVFGVRDDGTSSGWDPEPLLQVDSATVTDKVAKYTGRQFSGFEIAATKRAEVHVAVLVVDETRVPMPFSKPGTHVIDKGRQRTVFAQGTVYFRHGSKSEPATADDLATVIDRRLAEERDHLLANVRKVFQAPPGQGFVLVPGSAPSAEGAAIRLTTDPDAPPFRAVRSDETYPFRQKEVIEEVNRRISGHRKINTHDLKCVRKVHAIDAAKPEFVEIRRYGSAQYTVQFVEWLVHQLDADDAFFQKARRDYRAAGL